MTDAYRDTVETVEMLKAEIEAINSQITAHYERHHAGLNVDWLWLSSALTAKRHRRLSLATAVADLKAMQLQQNRQNLERQAEIARSAQEAKAERKAINIQRSDILVRVKLRAAIHWVADRFGGDAKSELFTLFDQIETQNSGDANG
jgi:chorismate mutase